MRTILDDLAAMPDERRARVEAALNEMQERAFMAGAWHMLVWMIAFYAVKGR